MLRSEYLAILLCEINFRKHLVELFLRLRFFFACFDHESWLGDLDFFINGLLTLNETLHSSVEVFDI